MPFLRRHCVHAVGLLVPGAALLLGGCSGSTTAGYQGYVEGEYVNVASPVAGRLDKLMVQRGQTIEAKTPLFSLEAEQERAAKQQAHEQLNASQAQLADLKTGRRKPEVAVTQAQLSQAQAALQQAALQLKRWIAEGRVEADCRISVNLSGAQLGLGQHLSLIHI